MPVPWLALALPYGNEDVADFPSRIYHGLP